MRYITVVAVICVSGCGFRLAQPVSLPSDFDRVAIDADDTRSAIYVALERELLNRGVTVDRRSGKRIRLLAVETGQRVLSVSARNIPREFEVFYTVAFTYTKDGSEQIVAPPLTLTRDYQWSELEVLGKKAEEESLRALIVADLVDSILRRIAAQG
ncbi:MAG: LPS assembly lipoprotein LptE [Pseudomonadota bacterium]